ncbi:MAG TPA: phosphotransferase [Ornithinibacter sp.]|nr:phosphotransferase [Ornithinibacter sp.]
MDAAYAALDEEGQVEVLRRVALRAAEAFGLGVRDLALVLHGYNTTFRLDTDDGRRLALRVNTNSHSTPANIAAQQAWLHALANETDVRVPDPVAAPGGGWEVSVESTEWGGVLHATVASWLDGDDVGECDEEQAHALGRTMAVLHDHAAGFSLPAGASLPLFDEPLFHDSNLLEGTVPMPDGHAEVIASALAECRRRFAQVGDGQQPIVLHADLHGGNLKWHRGALAVFDLDDAGFGVPALDLAISTFYLRSSPPAVEEALREGYAGVRDLPAVTEEQLEALVAARQLLLANSLLSSSTASLRAEATDYLDVTVQRLRGWQDTGRFRRAPAGE